MIDPNLFAECVDQRERLARRLDQVKAELAAAKVEREEYRFWIAHVLKQKTDYAAHPGCAFLAFDTLSTMRGLMDKYARDGEKIYSKKEG